MTAAFIYAHALEARAINQLNTRLRACGQAELSRVREDSSPGILFLGDHRNILMWRQRGHTVITCGSQGAYSVNDAADLLSNLLAERPHSQSPQVDEVQEKDETRTSPCRLKAMTTKTTQEETVEESFSFGNIIDPLIAHPTVTDILVNGQHVWVDRGDGLHEAERHFDSVDDVRQLAVRIAAYCGRRLDEASPIVDAALPSGIRLHAVLPPVAGDGPLISLRIPHVGTLGVGDMCVGQSAHLLESWMQAAIKGRRNCLISGATGSGKTTLLSAVLSVMPPNQRLVCIEEISELRPRHPHLVHLQERAANVQGAGGVSLSELVRAAVRMRPDRIIVGECRGAEVRDMLAALNTGHDGGWATIHANSVEDVPARLEALGALAELGPQALAAQVRAAFDLVIHMERGGGGKRRIAQMGVIADAEGRLRCECAALIDEDGRVRPGPAWERLQALLGLGADDCRKYRGEGHDEDA
ncbi:TadA family conjugal transfer-associated ATPase [Schaalia canis]|uniref:TadA family conjugal transfer-associated ATPase n=1 Tax=Schaalia canis TaxID=100469 RepID=A0A3P1SG91_9ACTO|nr:TadA family conjugal transfer-associated ATPase [Schaalia canis]RRC95940.1 TadA family conjugal transfer-associated ATPase [Schaalia canis]